MRTYISKDGETVTDIILNSTGNLFNWDLILNANNLTDWTPEINSGQVFIIPSDAKIDLDVLADLVAHSLCNRSVNDLQAKIDAIFAIMATAAPVTVPVFAEIIADSSKDYTVKAGESIFDAVINATGTLANLDLVLNANGFTEWVPTLIAGQVLKIPSTITKDLNAFRQFVDYPISNNSVNNIDAQIIAIFETINDAWILSTGFWNDLSVWKDIKTWID